MKGIAILLLAALLPLLSSGQGSAFGLKGGLTMGFQRWNDFQQDPLFKYHGIAFIESISEEDRGAVFAQVGFHVKGSAIRNSTFQLQNGNIYRAPAQDFQFRNFSLTLGGKKKYLLGNFKSYYMLGIRGDFTLNTNLSKYEEANTIFNSYFPTDVWVRRLNYGVTVGGGFEFPFSDLVGGVLEITVNPDLSRQYLQPPLENVIDPFNPGVPRSVPERRITNITLELTLGIRFLRIVEYVD